MIKTIATQRIIVKMPDVEFMKLSRFIYKNVGLKLPLTKKNLLQMRLQKRLFALKLKSFLEYTDYLFSNEGMKEELIAMIDMVTTNKTDFFRENLHFEFMNNQALPEILNNKTNNIIKVWSAGCSSGEEPYTIAMVLNEFSQNKSSLNYSIYAVDISTEVLEKAKKGIYKLEDVNVLTKDLKYKYLLKSKDVSEQLVKIKSILRNKINFERLNLINGISKVNKIFDIIFCRNTLIYFDRTTQEKVINNLCLKLDKGGYLFLGHSESIMKMDVPLEQIKPTIFKRI